VHRIRIFSSREQAQRLADELRPRFGPGGLEVEPVWNYPANEFGRTLPPDTAVSAALSLAARQLVGRRDPFEFLPPRVSAWEQLTARYASGKWRRAGVAAAAVLLVVAGMFAFQQWQLTSLRSRWSRMSAQVKDLQQVSQQITQYRSWFDNSLPYLTILKELTAAFPEDGAVTAKTLEVREVTENRDTGAPSGLRAISCAGNAASYAAWIKTVHQVGEIPGALDLAQQTRGKSPLQFTLDFRLNPGVEHED
jgi:hypothetical protein